VSIPPAPPGLSEHYSAPVLSDSVCIVLTCNPQRSHAACFAGKIVIVEVRIRKRLSGVHRAKKSRNIWGETPCSRADPHPSGWRSRSGTATAPVSQPVSRRLRNCYCASGVLYPRLSLLPSVILRDGSGLHRRLLAPEDARLH